MVYCTGVSLMDEDVWEFIWMKFHSSQAVSEKKILLEALTCSDNVFLLNRSERSPAWAGQFCSGRGIHFSGACNPEPEAAGGAPPLHSRSSSRRLSDWPLQI